LPERAGPTVGGFYFVAQLPKGTERVLPEPILLRTECLDWLQLIQQLGKDLQRY